VPLLVPNGLTLLGKVIEERDVFVRSHEIEIELDVSLVSLAYTGRYPVLLLTWPEQANPLHFQMYRSRGDAPEDVDIAPAPARILLIGILCVM
jgi:hypothetical protein